MAVAGLIGGIVFQVMDLTHGKSFPKPIAKVQEKDKPITLEDKEILKLSNNEGAFLKQHVFRSDRAPYVPPPPKPATVMKTVKPLIAKRPEKTVTATQPGTSEVVEKKLPFPDVKLVGVIENGKFDIAIISHEDRQEQVSYRVLDVIEGWTLEKIFKRSVLFSSQDQKKHLQLDEASPKSK